MALEDLAMFRALPGSTVFYPSDAVSTEYAVQLAANTPGVCLIRVSRPNTPVIYDNTERFAVGKLKVSHHPRHLRQHRAIRRRETEGESSPPSSTTTTSGSPSGNWRWVITPVIYHNTEWFAVAKLKVSHHPRHLRQQRAVIRRETEGESSPPSSTTTTSGSLSGNWKWVITPVIYHNNERFAVGKLKVSHHPRHLPQQRVVRCRETEGESSPPSSTTTTSGSLSRNWRWVITPVIYDNNERFAVGKLKVSHHPRHLRQQRAVRRRETEGESSPPSSTTTPGGSLSGNWRWVITPVIYDNTERFAVGKLKMSHHPRHLRQHRAVRCRETEGESSPPSSTTTPSDSPSGNWRWVITPVIYHNNERFAVGKLKVSHHPRHLPQHRVVRCRETEGESSPPSSTTTTSGYPSGNWRWVITPVIYHNNEWFAVGKLKVSHHPCHLPQQRAVRRRETEGESSPPSSTTTTSGSLSGNWRWVITPVIYHNNEWFAVAKLKVSHHPRHLRQQRAVRRRETEGESSPPSSTTTTSGSPSGNWRWVITPVIYDNTGRFAVGKLKVSHHPRHLRQHRAVRRRETEDESSPPSSTTTPSGSPSGNWRWVITPVIYDNTELFAVGKLKVSHHPRHLRQHRAVRRRQTEGESSPPSSTTTTSGSLSGNWRWVITPVIYDNTERFAVGKLKVSHHPRHLPQQRVVRCRETEGESSPPSSTTTPSGSPSGNWRWVITPVIYDNTERFAVGKLKVSHHPRHLPQQRVVRCRETEGESSPPSSTTTPSGSPSGNWRWVITPVIYDNTERFAVGKLKVSHHPRHLRQQRAVRRRETEGESSTTTTSDSLSGNWRWVITPVIYHNNERFAVGKLKVSHHPRHLPQQRAVRCRETEGESSPPSSTTTTSGYPSGNWRWVITPVIYHNNEWFAVGKLKVSHHPCHLPQQRAVRRRETEGESSPPSSTTTTSGSLSGNWRWVITPVIYHNNEWFAVGKLKVSHHPRHLRQHRAVRRQETEGESSPPSSTTTPSGSLSGNWRWVITPVIYHNNEWFAVGKLKVSHHPRHLRQHRAVRRRETEGESSPPSSTTTTSGSPSGNWRWVITPVIYHNNEWFAVAKLKVSHHPRHLPQQRAVRRRETEGESSPPSSATTTSGSLSRNWRWVITPVIYNNTERFAVGKLKVSHHPRHLPQQRVVRCRETKGESSPPSSTTTPSGSPSGNWRWVITPVIYHNNEWFAVAKLKVSHHPRHLPQQRAVRRRETEGESSPPSSTTTTSGSLSRNWRWVITPVIYHNNERFAVGKLKVSHHPCHLPQQRVVRCRETEGESSPPSSTTTTSGSPSGNWRWVITPVIYHNNEWFAVAKLKVSHHPRHLPQRVVRCRETESESSPLSSTTTTSGSLSRNWRWVITPIIYDNNERFAVGKLKVSHHPRHLPQQRVVRCRETEGESSPPSSTTTTSGSPSGNWRWVITPVIYHNNEWFAVRKLKVSHHPRHLPQQRAVRCRETEGESFHVYIYVEDSIVNKPIYRLHVKGKVVVV